MRRLAVAAALLLAACGAEPRSERSASSGLPFTGEPGTEFAPRYSPVPPPRGVAPAPSSLFRSQLANAGPVCGDSRIIGVEIGRIRGSISGCGIDKPVRVSKLSGVPLSTSIRVNCATAKAAADWIDGSVKRAAKLDVGVEIASIRPVASYACRTRNHQRGARLSEHAKGNAIDFASFTFADGTTATVLNGFEASGGRGDFLRKVWKGACGPFGTVLGPRADRFHTDHFHFDTARHTNGPYCR
ncbi:MAG: extensin family protein [Pseudomonadota bacterium]